MNKATYFCCVCFILSGCIAPSRNIYEAPDVGRVIETSEGTVVSSRPVTVAQQPQGTGYGPLAGGALGAGVGFQFGEDRGNALATILGALVGAGAGYLAERSARTREGIEYVIRTDDGRTVTVVQNRDKGEEPIAAGTPVLLQDGGTYTRVLERPHALKSAPQPWSDPDEGGGPQSGGIGSSDEAQQAVPLGEPGEQQ